MSRLRIDLYRHPLTVLTIMVALALGAAACGADDDDGGGEGDTTTSTTASAVGQVEVDAPDETAQNSVVALAVAMEQCGRAAEGDWSDCAGQGAVETAVRQAEIVSAGVEVDADADGYAVTVTSQAGTDYTIEGSDEVFRLSCDGDGSQCEDGTWDSDAGAISGLRGDRDGEA